jgi:thioredoxin-related protein
MSSLKKIELIANLAIIIVAILLSAILISLCLPHTPSKAVVAESLRIMPGTKLSLPGLAWDKGSQTLLIVLSTNCHYCTESAPFYQRLVQQKARRKDIHLVAILPESAGEAQKYLSAQGISVDEIRQSAPNAVYARSTPTLILVDRTGSVIETWVGKLPPQKEEEVLGRFLSDPTRN